MADVMPPLVGEEEIALCIKELKLVVRNVKSDKKELALKRLDDVIEILKKELK